MRRPPIACQRAVQSLHSPAPQYICISDDVLSRAVHRFSRTACPSQKRHGSNVPGPLEARKRAAKRRMTVSAAYDPPAGFPTSFSLGALFGYTAKPQTSWRYEPPSLPKDALLDSLLPTWDSAQLTELYPQIQSNNTKPCEFEKCFKNFKDTLAAAKDRHDDPWFLKDSFRQCLPSEPLVWKYHVAVLQHTLQLGWSTTPVLQCLIEKGGHLLRSADFSQSLDDRAQFLDCLDSITAAQHARKTPLLRRVYSIMAQSATEAGPSTTEAHDTLLLRLIKHNERSPKTKESTTTTLPYLLAAKLRKGVESRMLLSLLSGSVRTADVIISTVRKVTAAPDCLASAGRALFYMPRQQLLAQVPVITARFANHASKRSHAQSLETTQQMEVWLQLLQQVDTKANISKALLEAAMVTLAKGLVSSEKTGMVRSEFFVRAVLLHQRLDCQIPTTDDKARRFPALFADVLRIQADPKAYSKLLDTALPLVARHAGLTLLLRCLRAMEEQKLPLSTEMDFEAFITQELGGLHASATNLSESQLQTRAYTLQACEKLLNVLSRMGCTLSTQQEEVAELAGIRQFENLLAHATATNALPIAFRGATSDMSLTERVGLVHQLAYHYSQDKTRTHREAWRSIYYLFNYLKSNSLPVGPLLTKAIVHSSITRPLMENRFVSARRLIWVCHLVAKVEGNEVAARVENHFYTWRGDLIGRAKRIYIGVGGRKQDKANIGTMKRLGLI